MSTCNNPLALCKSTYRENFWMNDFSELYKNNNFMKFFPTYNSTRTEQLNALTRFLIYFMILALIFNKSDGWLYLPITGIVIIVIAYNINKNDSRGKKKELDRILKIRQEKVDKLKDIQSQELHQDGDEEDKLKLDKDTKPYDTQFGYIDPDGNLSYSSYIGPGEYHKNSPPSLYTVDELEDYRKNTCRKPTKDNPFMNPDVTEYNNGDPPAACNADDDDIKDDMRLNFNHDLFRDVDDLWERKNSQRQFYTMPNTAVPNQQQEFAEWLYKIPKTCKEDGINCLRYEDLRFKR
ncbi:MAG: hypothetical protein Homavirus13_7 [Homavirus sp.]|uniref:Minor capsid protein P9 transmembrane helices domain-containing protein n=1 Tax=Homavirus sp. TaxID=2487769 RepID=A0A3G5A4N2_9VIRU|nr:MAG: hypothetical protein Homavirus13_7 [Homavirus sp.]